MSFLNWLSFLNEDKQDTNYLDLSLVLPLTVGLGTVAVSVFLGLRNSIYPASKAASPVLLHTQDSAKRKPLKSPKPKNKPPLSTVQSSEKSVQPAHPPSSTETPLPTSSSGKPAVMTDSLSRSFTLPSESTTTKPQPVIGSNSPHTSPSSPITTTTASSKKSKKSKRSSRPTLTVELIPPSSDDPSNGDQWVTVTSKKVRQVASNTTKHESPRKPARSSTNQLPSSPDPTQSLDCSTNQETVQTGVVETVIPTSPTCPNAVHEPPLPSDQSSSRLETPTEFSQTWSASHSTEDSKSATDKPGEAHVAPVTGAHRSLTSPLGQIPHLPAMDKLLSQHLPAQLQAKELECQTLRTEVIRLREDVRLARESHPPRYQPPPRADASTLTEPADSDVRSTPTSPPNCQEPVAPATAPPPATIPRSPSPDAVLLRTLQDEIARLAKEVTLLNQRNVNLEERLETTKTQLAVAKKKASRDTKSIRQQLDTELERAETAERTATQLELKLQESLKQNEIQRRVMEERDHIATQQLERARTDCAALLCQKEQWERDQISFESEKQQLLCKCDELTGLNQTHQLELECMHRNVKELNEALRDAQSRLNHHQLDSDRVAELERSVSRVNELEAHLALHQRDAAEHRSKLEDTVVELRATVDRLSTELDGQQCLLADRVADCTRLEDEVSRLQAALAAADDEHEHRDSCPGTDLHHVVAAGPATLLEISTQTDPEPSSEFEPSSTANLPSSTIDPVPNGLTDPSVAVLMDQVQHYKSTLDKTELMLSKLQMSVDQEEQRWREALVASKMECELLESKISKLETSLSTCLEERDKLTEAVRELQREHQVPRVELEAPISIPGLSDTVEFDESTPSAELIRTLTWLRHLVRIKDEALEKEQAKSDLLQSKLDQATRSTNVAVCHNKSNGHSSPRSPDLPDPAIPNGRHTPTPADSVELNGMVKSG